MEAGRCRRHLALRQNRWAGGRRHGETPLLSSSGNLEVSFRDIPPHLPVLPLTLPRLILLQLQRNLHLLLLSRANPCFFPSWGWGMQTLDLLGIYPALTCARHLGGGEAGKADALAARHIAVSNLRGKGRFWGWTDGWRAWSGSRSASRSRFHRPRHRQVCSWKYL